MEEKKFSWHRLYGLAKARLLKEALITYQIVQMFKLDQGSCWHPSNSQLNTMSISVELAFAEQLWDHKWKEPCTFSSIAISVQSTVFWLNLGILTGCLEWISLEMSLAHFV